jgi:hypothetical protein
MKRVRVAALENKRAELMAEIQITGRRMAALLASLASVEAAISTARTAPIARRSDQISRTILDVLRRALTGLSETEIISAVAAERRLAISVGLARQVRAALSRHRDGLLVRDDGEGIAAWRVADKTPR